jgi:hypothetical protein
MPMRYYLTLLFVLAVRIGYAQFEDLSDAGIVRFMTEYSEKHALRWQRIDFEYQFSRGMRKDDSAFIRNLAGTHYIYADLNNDGVKDLVFNGRIASHPQVIAFLSHPNGPRHYLISHDYPQFPMGISSYDEQYLVLHKIRRVGVNVNWQQTTSDTLRYFLDGFANYQPAGIPSSPFDTLQYHVSSGWSHLKRSYYITGKGQFVMEGQVFNAKRERYETVVKKNLLPKPSVDSLQQMIQWMGYQQLPPRLDIPNLYDAATMHTRVVFKDGIAKQVDDYGGAGNYNLQLLYKMLQDMIAHHFPEK